MTTPKNEKPKEGDAKGIARFPIMSGGPTWAMYPPALKSLLLASEKTISIPQSQTQAADAQPEAEGGVVVIPIHGPMMRNPGFIESLLGIVDTAEICDMIRRADADLAIRSIVLSIDSPGGSTSGVTELADIVAGTETPIVAQVEGICASAALWVASQADKVYAGRTDLIGSIGVYMVLYDESEAYANEGIKPIVITTGEFKGMLEDGGEITDAHKVELQKIVDFYFDAFKSSVVRGRGLTKKEVEAVADGRIFPAPEAKALGLIDGIETLLGTIAKAQRPSRIRRARAQTLQLCR